MCATKSFVTKVFVIVYKGCTLFIDGLASDKLTHRFLAFHFVSVALPLATSEEEVNYLYFPKIFIMYININIHTCKIQCQDMCHFCETFFEY